MSSITKASLNPVGFDNPELSAHWYAVQVRSNHECVASGNLISRNVEVFLPTYTVQRQWSDRVKQMELPLFPGYMFCRIVPEKRRLILTAPGVVGILSCGKVPLAVPEEEVEAVRRVVRSKLNYSPSTFSPGERVRIHEGPLSGIEGTLLEVRQQSRVLISVSTVQRAVSVEIDRRWVRSIDTH